MYCSKPKHIWRLSPWITLLWMTGALYSAVRQRAPDFSRLDVEHRQVSLSAYQGKVVLLNFWATWCAPCLVEIPRFDLGNSRMGNEAYKSSAFRWTMRRLP